MKKLLLLFSTLLCVLTVILARTAHHYKHKSSHRFEVTIPIQKELLEQKIAKGPSDWMREQIRSDLSSYEKTGITQSMLNQLFRGEQIEKLSLVRFTVSHGHLSFSIDENLLESRQFRHLLTAIQKLHRLAPLPDIDFIVSLEDSINEEKGCPLFVFAKKKEILSLPLIPDFKAMTGYPGLRQAMAEGSKKFPWGEKVAQAFWRGASTGGWLTATTWPEIPRCKLALLSLAHPEILDARLNGVVQCDPEVPALIRAKGVMGTTVSQIDHLKYKYLVDVDGNSCSFERYFWALLSNSLVLKQMTSNIQWYYGALKPYEHFVPVKEDLSDLIEQYHWALEHDVEAQKIAQNATEFVAMNLTVEDVFLYLHSLLHEYAKLQR